MLVACTRTYASIEIIERTRERLAAWYRGEGTRGSRRVHAYDECSEWERLVRRDPDVARLTDARLVAAVTEPLSHSVRAQVRNVSRLGSARFARASLNDSRGRKRERVVQEPRATLVRHGKHVAPTTEYLLSVAPVPTVMTRRLRLFVSPPRWTVADIYTDRPLADHNATQIQYRSTFRAASVSY